MCIEVALKQPSAVWEWGEGEVEGTASIWLKNREQMLRFRSVFVVNLKPDGSLSVAAVIYDLPPRCCCGSYATCCHPLRLLAMTNIVGDDTFKLTGRTWLVLLVDGRRFGSPPVRRFSCASCSLIRLWCCGRLLSRAEVLRFTDVLYSQPELNWTLLENSSMRLKRGENKIQLDAGMWRYHANRMDARRSQFDLGRVIAYI